MDWVRALSAADRALSELAGVGRTLPNPHLLIRPFARKEAVLSSRIEGTQASLSDLFFFEAAQERKPGSDVREVANYVTALEHGLSRLSDLPVCLRLVREVHGQLMAGVRGQEKTPGEFRRSQNWIGPVGCSLNEARYVPPPPEEMDDALAAFERYLHSPTDLPPLVRMALIHYQFEAIHPFLDGNGRMGRLLLILLLCHEKLLPQPLLYMSAYFERNREEYYRRLLDVSLKGAWEAWVLFFLRGIEEQALDAVQRSDRLLSLWGDYRHRLHAERAGSLSLRLVDDLFHWPALSVMKVAARLPATPAGVQRCVDRLERVGILRETTGAKRNRMYLADEIVGILEEP
ncbi:MAG: Fic family protein [Lentisphaerae bacterium]|nr:Fic family protein [Lentisphaerota bacterium]